jgi:MFS transporter, FHS family, Na+ dependent glucose transporter 1
MTKSHPYLATAAYYLSFIVLGLTTAASGPSLPKLAEHTSSGLERISLIFIFGSLGYLLGSFFGGRAYDRLPSHKLMAVTLVLIGIACILIPIARTLIVLLFAIFLNGLASGILDVGGNTLLIWTHGEKSGPFMNGLHFFFGVGSLIAPLLLARILLLTGDITWMFWTFTIACIPMAIWFWYLAEPTPSVAQEDGKNTSFPIVPVMLVVVLLVFYVGLEMGFGSWIYTYALTLNLETEITAAYLTSAFWGSFTFGRLVAIWISTRFRPVTIIWTDIIGCVLGILIIMLWKDSNAALWSGTIILGFSMASMFPTIILLAGERIQITGTVTGLFLLGSGGGNMLLPWLIGQIFAYTGPRMMTAVLMVDIVLSVTILFIFLQGRSSPLPEPVQ